VLSGYLSAKEIRARERFCFLCHSDQGKMNKFLSHGNQRKAFICKKCFQKLGRGRIQQMLEEIPLPQKSLNFFNTGGNEIYGKIQNAHIG